MPNKDSPFSPLDNAFAEFLCDRARPQGAARWRLKNLLANLSKQQNEGHSCLLIQEEEKELLRASGLATDSPDNAAQLLPLVIEDNRLYSRRYWHYEERLAKQIKVLAQSRTAGLDPAPLLRRYFGIENGTTDWQREAVKLAVDRNFCIITGGPGTGKTTTVCRILAVLQELAETPATIALAAPTGKAAMRLQESLAANLARLPCPDNFKQRIPCTATTLHRLLGAIPPSPYFKHDAAHPLAHDIVVIDEASMIDLALMGKLVDAIKPGAKLILLGDKDQLVSVESGAVLADLIAALPYHTVELTRSYRFEGGIGELAREINLQHSQRAWELIAHDNNDATVKCLLKTEFSNYLIRQRQHYAELVRKKSAFGEIQAAFNQFQVLCATRLGPQGTVAICKLVEHKLFGQGSGLNETWYPGRPVIVERNNHALGLFNGDIGICLPDPETGGQLMVYFQQPDGNIRRYLPSRLPPCSTAFALTVHKSQGSEFDNVALVLPENMSPVLSKELLYTAITRAKISARILADKAIFETAVGQKIVRITGLADRISAKQ